MSYLQFIILFLPDNRVLSAICIFLQCKDHIGIPLKKAGTFLPAYPAFTVLQADELLPHLSSAVWAYFITFSHWQTPIEYYFAKSPFLRLFIYLSQIGRAHV